MTGGPDAAAESGAGVPSDAAAAPVPGPDAGRDAGRDAARRPAGGVEIALALAAALVVLDQATKSLVLDRLAPGRFVPFLGPSVGWQLVFNPGGAWGIPAPHWVFLVVTVVVVGVVAVSLPRVPSLLQAISYGLLLAGALGNAIDRVLRAGDPSIAFGGGYVVDFVAWGTFPRFNVADASITVGFLLLVVALWRDDPS